MGITLDDIAKLESDNLGVDEGIDDLIKQQRANDQSKIALIIVWAFVAMIFAIFLIVTFNLGPVQSCQSEDCAQGRWQEPATFLLTMVSSVMLPIVTLVLGYYFGTEKKT
jgi:ABC-type microcin C transport system permease subunit YejB